VMLFLIFGWALLNIWLARSTAGLLLLAATSRYWLFNFHRHPSS
jgi:hypothetical protein